MTYPGGAILKGAVLWLGKFRRASEDCLAKRHDVAVSDFGVEYSGVPEQLLSRGYCALKTANGGDALADLTDAIPEVWGFPRLHFPLMKGKMPVLNIRYQPERREAGDSR